MHTKEIGRERPKVLPIKRERGILQNGMDKNLTWDGWWKREKTLGMPRCSGGKTSRRVVSTFERCSHQTKVVGEQQGKKGEIVWA